MESTFTLADNWPLKFTELGLNPRVVLHRGKLPENLFQTSPSVLSVKEYFQLYNAIAGEMADTAFGVEYATKTSTELGSPAMLAAMSCKNFNLAAKRISKFSNLISPMKLHVSIGPKNTTISSSAPGYESLCDAYGIIQMCLFTEFIRKATNAAIHPQWVGVAKVPAFASRYENYFGTKVHERSQYAIAFSASDAKKPFLTANSELLALIEPDLHKRLLSAQQNHSFSDKVLATIYALLPSGKGTLIGVSSRMGISTRTLQRKLSHENTTYNQLLIKTREELARQYLKETTLKAEEIAFLLGYDEATSFFHAFRKWTGQTPNHFRKNEDL